MKDKTKNKPKPIYSPGGIHVVTWNIHDIQSRDEGLKTNLADYKATTNGAALVCLQETKQPIKVPGFRCFNSNRAGSRSGGVCIAVANEMFPLITPVPVDHPDVVAVKLSSTILGSPVILITAYDSPDASSFKKRRANVNDESVISSIEELFARSDPATDFIVCGDFNARIGNSGSNEHSNIHTPDLPGLPDESCIDPAIPLLAELPPRSSEDTKTNSKARAFLQMVQTTGLAILNGRAVGDIYGATTCVRPNGVSTVDYFCTTAAILPLINSMVVGPVSTISDHRPLHLKLRSHRPGRCPATTQQSTAEAPKGFRWVTKDQESGAMFLAALSKPMRSAQIQTLLQAPINSKSDSTELNNQITNIFLEASVEALRRSKPVPNKNKAKWYDEECRTLNRKTKRAANKLSKKPSDQQLLDSFHAAKRKYRKTIRLKKALFHAGLNTRIESNNSINWANFKQLKSQTVPRDEFDALDLHNFYCFFKDLYTNQCHKSQEDHPGPLTSDKPPGKEDLATLNSPITHEELQNSIKELKSNKSPSLDLIRNEMLKNITSEMFELILKHLNGCLSTGNYPWNESVTTVIHKKGDKENPDNYRAITLGSCMGKLFSSILLKRLIAFRGSVCPDTTNQLGFCKNGQTSDHLLALKTVLDKYLKKKRVRVYACFVDMKKAFDRVCRQGLLKKLADLGIEGNFFSCLTNMYSNSSTRIKLSEKLSERFWVKIGTEQGHPLSPELFKIFIHELSVQLNADTNAGSYPTLDDRPISHLMWADDIVILALDGPSLQHLLDTLGRYTQTWELEVNLGKTQVMIFNAQGKLLVESHTFTFQSRNLASTKEYCYLGLTFSLSGSLKHATEILSTKGRRALVALKRNISAQHLSGWSLMKLFDHLISPILTYGCQIWMPTTEAAKGRLRTDPSDHKGYFKRLTADSFERVHLSFLKWSLGVHGRATNTAVYGETGRAPLIIASHQQAIKYFTRALSKSLDKSDNSLLALAVREQRNLQLEWFTFWDHSYHLGGRDTLEVKHVEHWQKLRQSQSKLGFYNQVQHNYGYAEYLNFPRGSRSCVAKLRLSAHDLLVETGRYNGSTRTCRYCTNDEELNLLLQLPMAEPIWESELHALTECPEYEAFRRTSNMGDILREGNLTQIFSSAYTPLLNRYLAACRAHRKDGD